jgi:hypothetical protein
MNNPFEGKAIKFETEQELNHLAELARGYGLDILKYTKHEDDYIYFRYSIAYNSYSNFKNGNTSNTNNVIFTYSDFIASLQPIPTHMLPAEYCKSYVEKTCKDIKQGRTLAGWYVSFDNRVTATVLTPDDAWRSAYGMLVNAPTPNHTEQPEMVNHPPHYTVNGIEVIDVIECYNLNFKLGNSVKYILRADLKGNRLQDLKKALWYLQREIEQSEK